MRSLIIVASLLIPYLLIGQAQEANLLGTWDDPDLPGSSTFNNTYNEIWGLAVNGSEFAVVGSTAGTHFIDVTDPQSPEETFFVAGAAQGGVVIHRDYHDYNGYLYAVCDEGPSTLQIIDISNLPNSIEVVYDSNELLRTAHNIFIDSTNAMLYVFATNGGTPGYSAMRVYDLADPLQPAYIGEYAQFGGIFAGHVHDGYVRDNLAFLNLGNDGFAVVDFTDPQNPVTLSTLTNYPFSGYNHSGWTSDDCSYYYMADENHGFDMKVVDVNNPCEAEVVEHFDAEATSTLSIPHNQVVACNYLYSSYYYDGVQIYDISDPANPVRVLYFDSSDLPNIGSYEGVWGVYPLLPSGNILISDMQNGLFVIEGPGACIPNENISPCNISCADGPTAVKTITLDIDVKIFPQPVSEFITVNTNLTESQNNVKLTLMDASGRIVQRWENTDMITGQNEFTLSLNDNLNNGLYWLQFLGDQLNLSKKVVVQR